MWGLLGLGSKFAAFIPGGQIFGILGAIGSAIAALVRGIVEGISVALANPVVFLIVALGFGGGFWEGLRWQESRVETANARIASMEKQWKDANARNANDLSDALLARQKAEQTARDIEKAGKDAAVRAGRAAERVRQPQPGPAANPNQPGWSLPSIPSLLKSN